MEVLEEHIAALERSLARAHLDLDVEAIARLLHADYVNLNARGEYESRDDLLASLKEGSRHWDVAESDDMNVRITGECAVVTGCWRGAGSNRGEPFDYAARFISVWVRENGQWRNLAYSAHETASG